MADPGRAEPTLWVACEGVPGAKRRLMGETRKTHRETPLTHTFQGNETSRIRRFPLNAIFGLPLNGLECVPRLEWVLSRASARDLTGFFKLFVEERDTFQVSLLGSHQLILRHKRDVRFADATRHHDECTSGADAGEVL